MAKVMDAHAAKELRDIQERFGLSNENIEQFHRSFMLIAQASVDAGRSEADTAEEGRRVLGVSNAGRHKETDVDSPRPWESTAHITLSNKKFFDLVLGCSNGKFFDALCDLVATKDFHAIRFQEFLHLVLTFGFFKMPDIIQFFFFALDKNRSGLIARTQLLRFVEAIHGRKRLLFETTILPKDDESSTRTANPLPAAEERRNTVNHAALTRMCAEHPQMLIEPISRLQTQLRRRLLGE